MKRYIYSLGVAALLAGSLPAFAQQGYFGASPQYPLHWYVDAGAAVPAGQTSNNFDTGWSVGGGLQWRPAPGPLSLRLDLNYSRSEATNQLLGAAEAADQTAIDDGWNDTFTFDLDAVFDIPLGNGVTAYVMGGGGGAYQRLSLTQTVGFGGYYCDGWGYCSGGYYPGDVLVDRESTTKFEWNAGVGVNFPLWGLQSWFVEARYEEIQTPTPTKFIPIRVGFRF